MVADSSIDLAQFPSELISALVREAADDADMLMTFLDALSQTPAGQWLAKKPELLSRNFLLGVGSGMRLLAWETSGIHVHRDAGLPSANEALLDACRAFGDQAAAARNAELPLRVVALFIAQFAWTARLELNAEITLGEAKEDIFLETLADFLWARRPS